MNQLIKEYVCAHLGDRYTPELATLITEDVIIYGGIKSIDSEEEIDFLKETISANTSIYITF